MEITYELARKIVIYGSWIVSLWIMIFFNGMKLYIKGYKLLSDEYEELNKYDRISVHVFTVSIISIIVIIVFGSLYYYHEGGI